MHVRFERSDLTIRIAWACSNRRGRIDRFNEWKIATARGAVAIESIVLCHGRSQRPEGAVGLCLRYQDDDERDDKEDDDA